MRRYALNLSEAFLPAAFIRVFGDAATNPRGFDLRYMGELLAIPPSLGTTRPCDGGGVLRCVRVGEIGGDEISLTASEFLTLPDNEVARFSIRAGDILLARAIGSEEQVGKLTICQPLSDTVVFDSHVMRVRPDRRQALPEFLATLLRTSGGRRLFMGKARRTAVQWNISGGNFADILIPVPPMPQQQAFVAVFQRHARLRAQQREALRQVEHLFQTLLHGAFC